MQIKYFMVQEERRDNYGSKVKKREAMQILVN